MITIIDYGMGNLRSVQKAFDRLKINTIITSNKDEIKKSDKLILPGVGHFRYGMENLKKLDLIDVLNTKVIENKAPLLGICLGMQLLTKYSDEGKCEGLGWLDVDTRELKFAHQETRLKRPHMGWNTIHIDSENPLLKGCDTNAFFYFVHSYYVERSKESCIAYTKYGKLFSSVIAKNNIFGTQFHPEKSHQQGLKILKNFAELEHV
jgi:glutamine amidotransferase